MIWSLSTPSHKLYIETDIHLFTVFKIIALDIVPIFSNEARFVTFWLGLLQEEKNLGDQLKRLLVLMVPSEMGRY